MRRSNNNLSILRSFPSRVVGNRKMVDKEQCFSDVLAQLGIYFVESL